MIHACNSREWYVNQYLIPSMLEQGINRSDIILHLDFDNRGCLDSCMRSFAVTESYDCDGIWHLQDDIIICSDFKKRTEELDSGLVCGFCCEYDAKQDIKGVVALIDMWYSFPCIRIPNKFAYECARWYYTELEKGNAEIEYFARKNKNDDLIFKAFLERHYIEEHAILVTPNLVDHVDYLIGGSTVNKQRGKIVKSKYFTEPELVEKLKEVLKNND